MSEHMSRKTSWRRGDAVAIHEIDEIPLRVACQRRLGEMRVLRQERVRGAMQVGKVAAPTARYAHFLGRARGMVDHKGSPTTLGDARSTEQAGSPGAENERVDSFIDLRHGSSLRRIAK